MAVASASLNQLDDANRAVVEAWLVEFEHAWDDRALARAVGRLPAAGHPLRLPSLVEMVRIDLERQWAAGRRVLLEAYLGEYPELAADDAVVRELIEAECEVRRQFGEELSAAERDRRFPQFVGRVGQPDGHSVPPPSQPAARDTAAPRTSTHSMPRPASKSGPPPERFGRYRILRELGSGGMGSVYLAEDTQLERRVALKVPHFRPEDGPDVLERFLREARAAATLSHPNLCPVFEVGEFDGTHYLTMEYIEGRPLADYIRPERPVPPRQAAAIVRKLALALHEAHQRGILHRDLKPSNVMINHRREPVIMDFGLARRTQHADKRLTQSGSLLGTPAYMPPEQVRGETESLGPACDIYSLGVILYELLTSRLPFEGPFAAVLAQILTAAPEPPSRLRDDVPADLEATCLKAMAKRREDRYASMEELATALAQYLRQPGAGTSGPMAPIGAAASEGEAAEPRRSRMASLAGQFFSSFRPGETSSSSTDATPQPQEVSTPSRTLTRRRIALLAAGLALAALGGIVIHITTKDGRKVVVQVDDPEAEVRIERRGTAGTSSTSPRADEVPTFDDHAPPPAPPAWVEPVVGRDPVPDEALIQQAEGTIRGEFKERLLQDKLGDRAALAKELLTSANAPVHASPERFARLRLARMLAGEAADFTSALEACEQLARWFEVDVVRMKAAAIGIHARFAGTPERLENLAEGCLALGYEALALDDYRYLRAVVRDARSAAQRAGCECLLQQADFLAEEAESAEAVFRQLSTALQTYAQKPDDPQANLEIGKFLCFVKHDWPRGLPMLDRSNDAALKAIAGEELPVPEGYEAQISLADRWWDASEQQTGPGALEYQRRARYWYQRALSLVQARDLIVSRNRVIQESSPPETDAVDLLPSSTLERIRDRLRSIPARPFTLRLQAWDVDYHGWRISPDGVESLSQYGWQPRFKLNHLRWKPNVDARLPNAGRHRLLPNDIDFASADVRVVARRAEYGPTYAEFLWWPRPDGISFNGSHWPTGRCHYYDVIITFPGTTPLKDECIEFDWTVDFYTCDPAVHGAPPDVQAVSSQEPVKTLRRGTIDFRWTYHGPAGVAKHHFLVVAQTNIHVPQGQYRIRTYNDDGIRVYVDDHLVIDDWLVHRSAYRTADVPLSAGDHTLRIEYFQDRGDASLAFWMSPLEPTVAATAASSRPVDR